MSDFRGGGGGSKMTPKNRTSEGKNRMLGGMGGQKLSKVVGHHIWMIPNWYDFILEHQRQIPMTFFHKKPI